MCFWDRGGLKLIIIRRRIIIRLINSLNRRKRKIEVKINRITIREWK